ncbi:MAG: hypothetical protein EOM87_06015, partial [Clostridia bacterium]|nr:hypothetical protein [Clostridia bacterium]
MEELTNAYFNSAYDEMYGKVIAYVITKCSNLDYVEDIVQDTFSEFYNLLERKGVKYINNRQAVIMRIAKFKVYKYYSLKSRQKNHIPLTKEDDNGREYDIEEIGYLGIKFQAQSGLKTGEAGYIIANIKE